MEDKEKNDQKTSDVVSHQTMNNQDSETDATSTTSQSNNDVNETTKIEHQEPSEKAEKSSASESKPNDATKKVSNGDDGSPEKIKETEPKVEMTEIPQKRLVELESAESRALEEIKRERASAINYRKRLEKQRDEFAEYASARVLTKVLEVNDDLARLLESGKDSIPKEHFEGIQLVKQRINGIFEAEGVKIIDIKEGKTIYNPKFHEAIVTQPVEEVPDNTIVTEVSSGFIKGDRVLRVAKVIIAKHPPKEKPVEKKSEEGEVSNQTPEPSSDENSDAGENQTTKNNS